MAAAGLANLVKGWVLGSHGFDAANTIAILTGELLMLTWIVWLGLVAARERGRSIRRGVRSARSAAESTR
jgi:hypothetical protein